MEISLISDTGVQFYTLPDEVTINLAVAPIKPQRFYEYEILSTTYLDTVLFINNNYIQRTNLVAAKYLNPDTNELTTPESAINTALLLCVPSQNVMSISRLNQPIGQGENRQSGLEAVEGKWLPLPFFAAGSVNQNSSPTDWCRMMLTPVADKCDEERRVYKVTLAVDTTTVPANYDLEEGPTFEGQSLKSYALCGVSRRAIEMAEYQPAHKSKIDNIDIPLSVFAFCDEKRNPWLNPYLQDLFGVRDLNSVPAGQKLKYMAYYIFLVSAIHKLGILPDIKLFNGDAFSPVKTNLVLDVGNSRTFGLLAEDPLNESFSNSTMLSLRDLGTGEVYREPFDMRLCFKEEHFGIEGSNRFKWPSVVRLGREALCSIYGEGRSLLSSEQYDTSHSSPKRYLWDHDPYEREWKFVTEKERVSGPAHTVYYDGIMQQFRSDGSFTANPAEMGSRAGYSRSSLMTFCFLEILLQARSQINSYEFRRHAGNENLRREIARVIITCPTAMTAAEQIDLRRSMEEACIALRRFYSGRFNEPYVDTNDFDKPEIIPSVADLSLSIDDIDHKRHWNYDEATCCQMVYLYSQLRRYLGATAEFFRMYGRRRNGEPKHSLTVASLDIGAGTSDIMICNYTDSGESVKANPLYYESFHCAGDDLVKRIITDVILESPKSSYPDGSGIITAKLRDIGVADVAEKMHHFFSDTSNMGVVECRMRKEFSVQVLIPTAYFLLDKLQKGAPQATYSYDDIFSESRPSAELMDFFATQMGFRYEELPLTFYPEYLNEIVHRVFEINMRKWAGMFHTFCADIVLLNGRPCSLPEMRNMMRSLQPVEINRIISMSDYRVGSWYPGSTDVGRFSDRKSLVAVGALIAYLAASGKLPMFKLDTSLLKSKIHPTSEYIGVMNTRTGAVESLLTPQRNAATLSVSGFPVALGTRQIDADGYPARMLYCLDYDDAELRKEAFRQVAMRLGLDYGSSPEDVAPELIADAVESIKLRTRANLPLVFDLERDYPTEKEVVNVTQITDSEGNTIGKNNFRLRLQSRSEAEAGWLDSGIFILHLGI